MRTQKLSVARNSPGESLGCPVALDPPDPAWVCGENQPIPGPSRAQPCLRGPRKCQEETSRVPTPPYPVEVENEERSKKHRRANVFMDKAKETPPRVSRKASSSLPPWPSSWCWDLIPPKQHHTTLESHLQMKTLRHPMPHPLEGQGLGQGHPGRGGARRGFSCS